MDRSRLTRRPLKTLGQLDELAVLSQPFSQGRLPNRLRALADRFSARRREGRREYNRKERERYRAKMPQKCDHRHKNKKTKGPKRLSPEKRLDLGRLRKR